MKKILLFCALFATIFSSCSNFNELNTNPDSTTIVTPEMIATGVLLKTFKSKGDAKEYINRNTLSKYVAMDGGAASGQYNAIGECSFDSYTALPNLDKMVEYSSNTLYSDSFIGLSSFIKAYNLYYLTMMTGDIPCSEAGLALTSIRKPKYDEQEIVLAEVLNLLSVADDSFAKAKNFGGDIIYNGDVTKWRKATNAFRLKVILTISSKATSEQKKEFAKIVSEGYLMESNSDNLSLKYTDVSGTWHPLYNQNLFNPYTIVSELVVDEFKKLNDRRLFYFAEPSEAALTAGESADSFDAYNGVNTAMDSDEASVNYNNGEYSIISKRYISEQASEPFVFLSFAEQSLILAEATEIGLISGDSKKYYEEGVAAALKMVASFDKDNRYNHGVEIDDAYISGYFNGEAAYKSASADRLKQIWMQRYLVRFMQDGTDAYIEFRRTKYPEFPLDPNTNLNVDNKSGFPMRWKYPSVENQTNEENLLNALNRQFTNGYDGVNELMWILK